MSVSENLTVAHHQQDTDYYCGAACAQMVLDSIGAGLLDQDDLYADNHSHSVIESGWATAPDGLQWTLNDRKTGSQYFALDALTTEDALSRMLVWTIHHWRVAPVALVFGWQHWIVVRGYTASASPGSSGDTAYGIDSFDVNNPWPPTPATPPPPPHSTTDGCGGGGTRGIANEHITYADWQATYMTGVPGGHWSGRFVAVCDPAAPPERLGQPPRRLVEPLRSDRLLRPKEAIDRAVAGARAYALDQRKDWRFLQKARWAEPVLVQRLDRPGEFYYIVPARAGSRVPAALRVDARTGLYQSSVTRLERGDAFVDEGEKATLGRVLDRRLDFGEQVGRVLLRKGVLVASTTLVWKPCRESLSPFFPFRMFSYGSLRIYVRTDGAIFTQLHDRDRGI